MRDAQREREELMNNIKENKRVEHEQRFAEKNKNLVHQSDLIDQMTYNMNLKETDREVLHILLNTVI